MSTSMLLTGAGPSGPGGGGEVDPLAGIPYLMRFETHWGDKVLRPDLFQDVARTISVTGEGDLLATMGPADAALVPSQSNVGMQGIALSAADGTPYIDFDGTDDAYPVGSRSGAVTYTVLLRSKSATWNANFAPVDRSSGSATRWGAVEGGGTAWNAIVLPNAVRRDSVALSSPFDSAPINQWMVFTVTTRTSLASMPRALMQLDNVEFGSAELIAFFIYNGVPTTEHRDAVEAFYETLKPAP